MKSADIAYIQSFSLPYSFIYLSSESAIYPLLQRLYPLFLSILYIVTMQKIYGQYQDWQYQECIWSIPATTWLNSTTCRKLLKLLNFMAMCIMIQKCLIQFCIVIHIIRNPGPESRAGNPDEKNPDEKSLTIFLLNHIYIIRQNYIILHFYIIQ